jgi:hypothetical protein
MQQLTVRTELSDADRAALVSPRCHDRVYGIQCSRAAEHAGEHGRGALRW